CIRTSIELAEMAKYTDNAWHALKIAFANEMSSVARAVGIDGFDVMSILRADTKLNLSGAYLRPGYAFGGSCLPKDVRALVHRARSLNIELGVVGAILPSNVRRMTEAFELVERGGRRRVSVLGMSFKPATDDLRESPLLSLVEYLIGKGYEVRIYDGSLTPSKLNGANREFLLKSFPHVSTLLVET